MDNLAKRLRELRNLKGLSQSDVARSANVSNEYVGKIEREETTNVGVEIVEALAKAVGVPPYILLYGDIKGGLAKEYLKTTKDRPPNAIDAPSYIDNDIPVISLVKAGRGGFFDDQGYPVGHGFKMIKRPEWIKDKHAYAVQVDGDSMSPALEKGWMVVVCPHDNVVNGNFVIAKLGEEYLLKKVRFQDGLIILQSVNQSYDPIACKKNEIDFLHKVCLIKPV